MAALSRRPRRHGADARRAAAARFPAARRAPCRLGRGSDGVGRAPRGAVRRVAPGGVGVLGALAPPLRDAAARRAILRDDGRTLAAARLEPALRANRSPRVMLSVTVKIFTKQAGRPTLFQTRE